MNAKPTSRELHQQHVRITRDRSAAPESRIPVSQIPISQLPVSQIPPSRIGLPHTAEGMATASTGLAGAAAGALAGAIAGPLGAVAGAAIGAVAGAFAGRTLEENEKVRAKAEEVLDKELGVIGGDIGAALVTPDPFRAAPRGGAVSASSAGIAGATNGAPDAGGRGE